MSCEHDIIFEITDSDDASFYIDVRDFVDRIISPNPYEGQTTLSCRHLAMLDSAKLLLM